MHELDPQYYRDLLLTIYPCKVPFTLAVKDDKPKSPRGRRGPRGRTKK